MRIAVLTLIALTVNLVVGSAQGADGPEDRRKAFLKKYDKNNNGKIDASERAAIRADWSKRFGRDDDDRRESLKIGSRIMFTATPDSLISLNCGDVPMYTGKMGRKGNQISIRIEERIEKKART